MTEDRRVLLKDQAYLTLKSALLDGEYQPGAFLSERQLAARLGMSKTPVRAALERLAYEGFIAVSPQQGIVVRELPIAEISDHYDIRIAIESFVTRRLAGRLTGEEIALLRANLETQRQHIAAGDLTAYVEADADFHLLMCSFLENQEIMRVMQHQRDKLHRIIHSILKRDRARVSASYDEHVAILDALAAGDGELAAGRLEKHLERGKRILI